MNCKKCKKEVEKKEKFCTSCGEKIKKPIYKRTWFIIVAVLVVFGVIGADADSDDVGNSNGIPVEANNATSNVSTKEEPKVDVVDPIVEEMEEFINTAEQVELFPGDFEVGVDIKAGRYVITSESGSGNLFVYEGQMPIINEILSSSLEDAFGMGVTSIEVDLIDGQVVSISGINTVNCTPATIELKTTFGAGHYLVGRDIPEGSYIATAPNGSGNFFVYGKNGMLKTNEILGKDDYGMAVEKVKIKLSAGDQVRIGGLEEVNLN